MSAPLAALIANQLNQLPAPPQGLAIGLSGGGDSWALTLAAQDYCRVHAIPFMALTVDHGLRPESGDEAQSVAAECTRRAIPHRTLRWQHDGIATRKQEQARAARYQLMGDFCAAEGFSHLLTAHHADDQAETVLLRFAKGSGAAGLAGIAANRPLNQTVTLLRPFLGMPKAALIAHAASAGVPIITDPSNSNPDYARARLRTAHDLLAAEGMTTATLLKVADSARLESEALDYATRELILKHLTDRILPAACWTSAPLMLQQLAWTHIWREVTGGGPYLPDRTAIQSLCRALAAGPAKRTLGGMIAERRISQGADRLLFSLE